MYQIYINDVLVILKNTKNILLENIKEEDTLVARYTGRSKHLLNYIDMCEKKSKIKKVIIHHDKEEDLIEDFLSLYTIVEAGGGLVRQSNGKFLFIFRRGHWDLPKGKMEKGESRKETAVREVLEETGLKKVELLKKLTITNHTYKNKSGKRLIKKSHWYLMLTKDKKLYPETEEDIEKAIWMDIEVFNETCKPVYPNIKDVLDCYNTL